MATTKYKIAEQINMLIKSNPTVNMRVNQDNVMLLVGQACNVALKADHFSVNMPEGDTIPNNCMIFAFDDIATETYKTTKSKCTLPFIPISLPRNVGVLHVSKSTDIDNPFVPVPTGMWGIINVQDLLGEASELITYEVVGKEIIFGQDLPGLGIDTVYMRLVGMDFTQVSIYDTIPLSADMEFAVIQEVYKLLISAPAEERSTDSN